jgi:hypothetical protein
MGGMCAENLGLATRLGRPGDCGVHVFLSFESNQRLRQQRLSCRADTLCLRIVGKQQRIEECIFRGAPPIVGAPGLMATIYG